MFCENPDMLLREAVQVITIDTMTVVDQANCVLSSIKDKYLLSVPDRLAEFVDHSKPGEHWYLSDHAATFLTMGLVYGVFSFKPTIRLIGQFVLMDPKDPEAKDAFIEYPEDQIASGVSSITVITKPADLVVYLSQLHEGHKDAGVVAANIRAEFIPKLGHYRRSYTIQNAKPLQAILNKLKRHLETVTFHPSANAVLCDLITYLVVRQGESSFKYVTQDDKPGVRFINTIDHGDLWPRYITQDHAADVLFSEEYDLFRGLSRLLEVFYEHPYSFFKVGVNGVFIYLTRHVDARIYDYTLQRYERFRNKYEDIENLFIQGDHLGRPLRYRGKD